MKQLKAIAKLLQNKQLTKKWLRHCTRLVDTQQKKKRYKLQLADTFTNNSFSSTFDYLQPSRVCSTAAYSAIVLIYFIFVLQN